MIQVLLKEFVFMQKLQYADIDEEDNSWFPYPEKAQNKKFFLKY